MNARLDDAQMRGREGAPFASLRPFPPRSASLIGDIPVLFVGLLRLFLCFDFDAQFVGCPPGIVIDAATEAITIESTGPAPGIDAARIPAASPTTTAAESGAAGADPAATPIEALSCARWRGADEARVEAGFRLFDDFKLHPAPASDVFTSVPGSSFGIRARDGPGRDSNPWLESRLDSLTLRLERRLSLDPDLRRIDDGEVQSHGSLAESQRQELNRRRYGIYMSEITYTARHEFDPVVDDMRMAFLEEPLFAIFSIDSSRGRGGDLDESSVPGPEVDGAPSASVGRPRPGSAQSWIGTLADAASAVVPGRINLTSSASFRRYRCGAELQPFINRNLPAPLRGLSFQASREYQNYLRSPEIVDRVGCWMDCFATRHTHGKLFVERESRRQETKTSLGFIWIWML